MPTAVGIVSSSHVDSTTETQLRAVGLDSFLETPDHPDFTFTSFDLSWFGSIDNPNTNDMGLFNQWFITGSMRSWSIRNSNLTPGPHFRLILSSDGVGNVTTTGTGMTVHGLTGGQHFGMRVTWRMSDGTVKIYKSLVDPPSWTLLGSATLLAGGPLRDSTGPIQICGGTSVVEAPGYFRRAEIRNGFDGAGSIVAAPDVTSLPTTATSFTDAYGKVWTLIGTPYLTTRPKP